MPSLFYFVTATVSKYITLFHFQEKNVGREAKKGKGGKKEKTLLQFLELIFCSEWKSCNRVR